MEIGVRALKERLSEYLDRAARGEVIVVTDRGQPKAVLGPIPGRVDLETGVSEGWIHRGDGSAPRPAKRFAVRPGTTTGDVLRNDRDE